MPDPLARPARVEAAREVADVADIVAVPRMDAGDVGDLVPARAFRRRDVAIDERGLGRERNDAAGVVGVAAPDADAVGAGVHGVSARREQRQRNGGGNERLDTHRRPSPKTPRCIAYRRAGAPPTLRFGEWAGGEKGWE